MSDRDSTVPRSQNDIREGAFARKLLEVDAAAYLTKERATLGVLTGTLKQGIFNAPACPTGAN